MTTSVDAPIIGITTYAREMMTLDIHPLENFRLPSAYVDAVHRAGGIPLLLPTVGDPLRLLPLLNGVVLTGGGDVNPARYGAARHSMVYEVNDERDAFEWALLNAALKNDLPILAICRGIQLLNVVLGGDLIQHLGDEPSVTVDHAGFPSPPKPHSVRLTEGTKLANELDITAFEAASWHHQAIGRVGKGLKVVARTDDGVIEAVELPSHRWCIGVQWHPEHDAGTSPVHQRLFSRFVQAATLK